MARCIARRIRSGTLVGPGTKRKLRPGIKSSSTRAKNKAKTSGSRFKSSAKASGAPRFLIVALQRAGRPPMHHATHVRLVDAHSERARRDDDRCLTAEEGLQHPPAHARSEPGVIRGRTDSHTQERPCQEFREAAR